MNIYIYIYIYKDINIYIYNLICIYIYGGTPFVFDIWVDQKANGVQKHGGNMKGTCVMRSNAKCFENESQRRNEKGNPIPAGKNQTLTKIQRDILLSSRLGSRRNC